MVPPRANELPAVAVAFPPVDQTILLLLPLPLLLLLLPSAERARAVAQVAVKLTRADDDPIERPVDPRRIPCHGPIVVHGPPVATTRSKPTMCRRRQRRHVPNQPWNGVVVLPLLPPPIVNSPTCPNEICGPADYGTNKNDNVNNSSNNNYYNNKQTSNQNHKEKQPYLPLPTMLVRIAWSQPWMPLEQGYRLATVPPITNTILLLLLLASVLVVTCPPLPSPRHQPATRPPSDDCPAPKAMQQQRQQQQ